MDDPELWIVVISAIASGFFALASFSLRSFSRARLEELFASRPGGSRWQERLEKHLNSLRLTISLCKAVSYLLLVGGVFTLIPDEDHSSLQYLKATLIAGAIISVVGVAIPHAWSTYASERVIVRLLPILLALRFILYPITAVMAAFDLPIRRLAGHPERETEEEKTEEARQEILQAAAEGQAEGAVDADELEMIESVMELDETDAAEIMTPRTDVFALEADVTWLQAAQAIRKAGHSRVPVYRENLDNILGIVYAKDLLMHIDKDNPPPITQLLRKPYFVPETKPLDDLLRDFKTRKVHLAIVLDEYGGTSGLVTIEDILEEIVGDISDEYDHVEESLFRRINKDTMEIDGRLRIDELNDLLETTFPEDEDFDTVAGYVVSLLGYIPKPGETVRDDQAEFTVLESDERKVSRLRVHRLDDQDETS